MKRNGLCFRCGEKWGHNHKCPTQVSLHFIEELLDALQDTESETDCEDIVEEETVLAVGHSTHSKGLRRRTMRLCAMIGKLQVLILVDSGSVGSFISQHLVKQLLIPISQCEPARYIAADDIPMICDKRTEHLSWSCQGHSFQSNVGILPLKCFNMILEEDWMEASIPMWVYWGKKVMKFTHQGKKNSVARTQA